MASISTKPNGRRLIQFAVPNGSRKTLRLGKCDRRTAETFKIRIERIVGAMLAGAQIDEDTVRWLTDLPDATYAKLVAVGLIKPRAALTLGPWLDQYILGRTDAKPATHIVFGQTKRLLIEFLGEAKPLREITEGDADDFRRFLIGKKLADNTVRRRCGIAKQFFRAAARKRLIATNPFAHLKAAVQANRSREYFITRAAAKRVLDACPDAQWRLLFALSRYGGLRCPSEHLALTWADVDWERGRMRVRSSKTEHHAGGESRLVPIFPELLPYLWEVFEQAEPGTVHVITRYREVNANLRSQLKRIIDKAGLEPWEKLFQNLRATRETELAETWPEHVVCAWIGNSRIARKHYLQVTEDHFERAAAGPEASADKALQNPTQQPVQSAQMAQSVTASSTKSAANTPDADFCNAAEW